MTSRACFKLFFSFLGGRIDKRYVRFSLCPVHADGLSNTESNEGFYFLKVTSLSEKI